MEVGPGFAAVLQAARVAAADIALITDAAQAIVYVSASFTAMTGYGQAELEGRNCRVLQGPGTDAGTREAMRYVLASGEVFAGEILNYRKDGSAFWTALRIIPMSIDGREITHFVSIQRDISNQVALLADLQNQALHDPVTGLPNRTVAERSVDDVIERALNAEVTVAVGLIDLDDFRLVNNTLGHAAGDEVLRQWAARMLSLMREEDVLARMGGDEFILILKNINRKTAHNDLPRILQLIHAAVSEPFTAAGEQLRIGMSLGLALVPKDGTDRRSILRSADEALYAAKENRNDSSKWWETVEHRNQPRHSDTEGSPEEEKPTKPADYFKALTTGNVEVHFQPVVNLRDGTVHLFEALARLKLPGGRLALPGEFLPHLDEEDLRNLFTEVVEQALGTLAAWDREGTSHNVSVNMPPALLLNRTLPAQLHKLLDIYQLQPNRLGLELLESADIRPEDQRATLRELTDMGVRLAMDDLGAGHSSLTRLSSFPFSAIKLDRGLFRHVHDRPVEVLSVMATLIQLGRDLGMNVAIEGLENESLTEAATVLGAPLGQGFYLAEPMPPEKCLEWSKTFNLPSLVHPINTSLGALAYHWRFARLAAPHPLELDSCPLTRFIHEATAPEELDSWHAHHHQSPRTSPDTSQLLTDWLTAQITEHNTGQQSS
ncbi:EAL domain-containing protein [Arthrobacter sp. ISL-85]|uniref:putative bifunctional diguanylate cyclase/phosphodiesterase n=1 Tax=Arthrobacter sp. ISL-85 TaxID=2819115 RepID=UPI001BEBD713|nr:EAL domain-containing protein [Arthrobacter sp. ISL-85]MBT2566231.1 EAL domain-containing protein [Arthrobacter sp. ISL-85]